MTGVRNIETEGCGGKIKTALMAPPPAPRAQQRPGGGFGRNEEDSSYTKCTRESTNQGNAVSDTTGRRQK